MAALRWLRGLSRFGPCEILAGCIAAPLPAAGGRERGKAWSRGNLPSAPASEVERLLRARIAQEVGDESVRVGVATSHGPVEDDLVALANSSGAELLVVGTPQRHGLARLGHHSVSRAVIRQAPMNILCVPATGGAWPETAGTVENGAEPLLKREAALTRAGVREAGPGASAGSAALGAT
ncbi:MAG: universal stress protein [Verrucomicrobia bacterium]|nr:universal stress protein [Verrucomicrobiota bacterium]